MLIRRISTGRHVRGPDLQVLPTVRDSWSYLYVEHCRIDQEDKAIAIHDASGKTPVPCAVLALLMLGPGTTIHPCRCPYACRKRVLGHVVR